MRILLSTRVFPPEVHPTGVMVLQLANYLKDAGWEPTIVTGFPNHPHGVVYEQWQRQPYLREVVESIPVIRVWHPVTTNRSFLARGAVVGLQGLGGAVAGFLEQPADIVLTVGFPLLGAVLWSAVARQTGARLVNVVYDLYPDIAIDTGHLKNRGLTAGFRLLERYHWTLADLNVVLSEGFRDRLRERGVADERIAVIPVWLDPNEIRPGPRDNAWRRENRIPLEKTVILYAGTIGVVSGALIVMEAARRLRRRKDLMFLFVGEGAEKDALRRKARSFGLQNVMFLPFQPRARLSEVQATADVGLVTLAQGRGRTSVPSKMVGYMAAARPVLASVDPDSDTGREVANEKVGVTVPAGDGQKLAEAIEMLAARPELRQQLGEAGRRRVEDYYAAPRALARYRDALERLIHPGRSERE